MPSTSDSLVSNESFAFKKLGEYKDLINEVLKETFSTIPKNDYPKSYPIHDAVDNAFLDVLHRGGKRLRGALAIAAYELFNPEVFNNDIYKVAGAVEIFQTYLLVLDDVDDQSEIRRKKPTAHKMLQNFHSEVGYSGSKERFGDMMTVYTAIAADHSMNNMLIDLSFSSDEKLKVLKSFNDTLHMTEYGQLLEAHLGMIGSATSEDVMTVHEYKTGHYTIYRPLEVGAILSGASFNEINTLKEFAISIGIAFQLRDDVIGLFGDPEITGKPAIDDLKEGKMTLLITYALENSNKKQKETLLSLLGKFEISNDELRIAQDIVKETGSYDNSESLIYKLVEKGQKALKNEFQDKLDHSSIKFLLGISDYIANREK